MLIRLNIIKNQKNVYEDDAIEVPRMNCMKCMKLVPERISLQRFETTGAPAFVSVFLLHRSPKWHTKRSPKFRGTPKLSNHEFYARTENGSGISPLFNRALGLMTSRFSPTTASLMAITIS